MQHAALKGFYRTLSVAVSPPSHLRFLFHFGHCCRRCCCSFFGAAFLLLLLLSLLLHLCQLPLASIRVTLHLPERARVCAPLIYFQLFICLWFMLRIRHFCPYFTSEWWRVCVCVSAGCTTMWNIFRFIYVHLHCVPSVLSFCFLPFATPIYKTQDVAYVDLSQSDQCGREESEAAPTESQM